MHVYSVHIILLSILIFFCVTDTLSGWILREVMVEEDQFQISSQCKFLLNGRQIKLSSIV